jgi:pimeloyl-ACP methyl ester carboxylesterase
MEIKVAGQAAYIYTGGKTVTGEQIDALPVMVFIHGAEQDHSCWNLQSRWFAHHGYAVLVPDLPGHGRSDSEPLSSIEALADWIVALLDAIGAARATLVGHSMGSLVALEASLRQPNRLEKIVLIGCAVPMPVSDPLLEAARHNEVKAAAMINNFSYSASGQIGGSAVPGLWLLGVNERLMARQKPGVFGVDLAACNAYLRGLESLAVIELPVLLIAGSQDRMAAPRASTAIAAAIPGARLETISGSGHALMAEKPDAVLDSLRDFLIPN